MFSIQLWTPMHNPVISPFLPLSLYTNSPAKNDLTRITILSTCATKTKPFKRSHPIKSLMSNGSFHNGLWLSIMFLQKKTAGSNCQSLSKIKNRIKPPINPPIKGLAGLLPIRVLYFHKSTNHSSIASTQVPSGSLAGCHDSKPRRLLDSKWLIWKFNDIHQYSIIRTPWCWVSYICMLLIGCFGLFGRYEITNSG